MIDPKEREVWPDDPMLMYPQQPEEPEGATRIAGWVIGVAFAVFGVAMLVLMFWGLK